MASILVILGVYCISAAMAQGTRGPNATNSTNDMYVIHATVYQVGIITNKSDEEVANMTGNQEALTFYHSNGSTVNLGAIPAPLVTNVTAQSVVGLAPTSGQPSPLPWAALGPMKSTAPTVKRSDHQDSFQYLNQGGSPNIDGVDDLRAFNETRNALTTLGNTKSEPFEENQQITKFRRSLENRTDNGPSIKVVKETALIPPAAGLQSIGLPSLIGLNTSFAALPVPIPNTSIVRYAKVNTLTQSPVRSFDMII